MKTVTFSSFISASLTMRAAEQPITGVFIQWGNSYILDKETKIPVTVAIVRSQDGKLFLANPLEMQLHGN